MSKLHPITPKFWNSHLRWKWSDFHQCFMNFENDPTFSQNRILWVESQMIHSHSSHMKVGDGNGYLWIWAGAVMRNLPISAKKILRTDRQTDRPTDRPKDSVGFRVARSTQQQQQNHCCSITSFRCL